MAAISSYQRLSAWLSESSLRRHSVVLTSSSFHYCQELSLNLPQPSVVLFLCPQTGRRCGEVRTKVTLGLVEVSAERRELAELVCGRDQQEAFPEQIELQRRVEREGDRKEGRWRSRGAVVSLEMKVLHQRGCPEVESRLDQRRGQGTVTLLLLLGRGRKRRGEEKGDTVETKRGERRTEREREDERQ
jgi:hypothetical protein